MQWISYKRYYLPSVEMKDSVLIDEQNVFDQPVKNNLRSFDMIWKSATGQREDHTSGCLLDYNY